MTANQQLIFVNKSYCFTGKLAELKRTQAEREVRARGGLTTETVNERLDYLVIGSIPAIGWKHRSYGNKIEKARKIASDRNSKLHLIPETLFMDALAEYGEISSGEIDEKVVVVKYKFIADVFDHVALEDFLSVLQDSYGCHVSVSVEDLTVYRHLFGHSVSKDYLHGDTLINCRIVKQLAIDKESQSFVDDVAQGFEGIQGVDGSLHWFEKKEGTAGYIRLLKEIPQNTKSTAIK